jgi:hypothetical protein
MTAITKQAISGHVISLRLATLLALFAAGIALVLTTAIVLAMLGGTGAEDARAIRGVVGAPAVSFPDYGERLAAAQAPGSVSFPDYGERLAAAQARGSVSFPDYGERLVGDR